MPTLFEQRANCRPTNSSHSAVMQLHGGVCVHVQSAKADPQGVLIKAAAWAPFTGSTSSDSIRQACPDTKVSCVRPAPRLMHTGHASKQVMEGIWCVRATCRACQTLSQVFETFVWAYAWCRGIKEVQKTFRQSTTSPSSVIAHRRRTQSTHSTRPTMQLSMRATGLRCSSSAHRQAPLAPVRPGRCRVARVSAEFVKQSDEKPSPQEQQQKAVKPETNGAAAPAAVVETPKPAATQQDALADLQELRSLIDEVRVRCGLARPYEGLPARRRNACMPVALRSPRFRPWGACWGCRWN